MDAFKAKAGTYPFDVFVYRDGISDGQLPEVVKKELVEVQSVMDACSTTTK